MLDESQVDSGLAITRKFAGIAAAVRPTKAASESHLWRLPQRETHSIDITPLLVKALTRRLFVRA